MGRKKDRQKLKQGGNKGQNLKSGDEFLEKNSKRTEIIVLESGLQYEIIKDESGNKPTEFDTVVVDQRTLLIDGKVLDDTYKTGKTFEINLQEALEGYREGLQLMSIGSRYKFYLPPELAWGRKGSGGRIGPNAVLIFDVKLVDKF
jgi:FKBP-type peptidyl-prolyl cis-trans isomerase